MTDVLVVGAGILGRSVAYALARAEPDVRVVLSGRRGPGASQANAVALAAEPLSPRPWADHPLTSGSDPDREDAPVRF
ncbi:FAD-dependent oxidoreductase [Streptomyces vietnamensis]|uniref:FAD-dependent oxidoreductase n=1 Tax=Streptomyces vietnamensis TaxID=362257 RepID=UPI0034312CCB